MLEAWWIGDNTEEGILKGHLNNLAVSAVGGTASPVTIATGAAMVKGFFYVNDAAGTKNIPTPAAATRVDRIVLRADYGSQVVRFQRVAGTEGAGTPALTQVANTTWEIPLAAVTVTTGGVVTVTNERAFLNPSIQVDSDMLKASSVTATALASGSVELAKMAANSVDATKIVNRVRSLFVQPVYVKNDSTDDIAYYSMTYHGYLMANGTTFYARGVFSIPEDYASGMSVKAVWGPQAWSDLIDIDLEALYGAEGTAYNNTYDSVGTQIASAGSGANPNWRTSKPTLSLSAPAVGDYVILATSRTTGGSDTSSDDVHFQGWKISYTADS